MLIQLGAWTPRGHVPSRRNPPQDFRNRYQKLKQDVPGLVNQSTNPPFLYTTGTELRPLCSNDDVAGVEGSWLTDPYFAENPSEDVFRGSSRARKQLWLTTGKTSRWIEVSSAQTECAIIILNLVGIFDRYPWPKRYFTSAARSGVGISDRHPPSRHADYLL